jgi:hypothetical protein
MIPGIENSPARMARPSTVVHNNRPRCESPGNQTMLRRITAAAPQMQFKLTIGGVNDPLEAEADNVANRVIRMPAPAVQRACSCGNSESECTSCKQKKQLQRSGSQPATSAQAPPIVHDVLRSPGRTLDPATRAFMEPRFGHDFSRVRVHTDEKAAASARAVNAFAYTVGQDVVFGAQQYQPNDLSGRRLLAHELTHVVQQSGVAPQAVMRDDAPPQTDGEDESKKAPAKDPKDSGKSGVSKVVEKIPVIGGIYKKIECILSTRKITGLQNQCRDEYKKHCSDDILSDDCQAFMGSEGNPSDAINKCVQKKDPVAWKNFLQDCAKAAADGAGSGH